MTKDEALTDPRMVGQWLRSEREWLYDAVVRLEPPSFIVETGTMAGTGSTLVIAHALLAGRTGRLVTIESDNERWKSAFWFYRGWADGVIECLWGDSREILPTLPPPDLFVCDGRSGRLDDVLAVVDRMKPGSQIAYHDWRDKHETSARAVLEQHPKLHIVEPCGTLAVLTVLP